MRIMIITQGISRIVNPLLDSKHDVVGIIECAPRGYSTTKKSLDFLRTVYHICIRFMSLKKLAKLKKIPYYFMTTSLDMALEDWIKNISPDLIVVFSMSQLLKKNIFDLPRYGTINIHSSLLPSYRGPNPDFWQYVNMEKNQGITIHFVDEGEDTGDILYQERVQIPLGLKSPERLDLLITETAVPALLKVIDQVEANIIMPQKQPERSPTTRARNLKLSEHEKFIDWENWPIEKIWNILRGTELWFNVIPAPKGLYCGTRWFIDDFVKTTLELSYEYGKIYKYKDKNIIVCKDGYINIHAKFNLKKYLYFIINHSR